jgi:YXWGXW repeat-containing protein
MFAHLRANQQEARMKRNAVRVAFLSALLGATLSGCVVAPAPVPAGVVVGFAPPPVRYEVVGVAPAPGYFWIGGAWHWDGGHYAWHAGYWQAPRVGYHWVAHTWVQGPNGWHQHPGHWAPG